MKTVIYQRYHNEEDVDGDENERTMTSSVMTLVYQTLAIKIVRLSEMKTVKYETV